jgi:predicted tellurium resistance membrane protein TerC
MLEAIVVIIGLAVFEIISSIDNAIVNATVLKTLPERYRRLFLVWGIFLGVFVVRGVLPFLIVWLASPELSLGETLTLVFSDPKKMEAALETSKPLLLLGGGVYLLYVWLGWLFLEEKKYAFLVEHFVHRQGVWFNAVAALILMVIIWFGTHHGNAMLALSAAVGSVAFFVTDGFRKNAEEAEERLQTQALSAWSKLIYLEVLDASFSIDGVIGAFAFTMSVPLILVGNGPGRARGARGHDPRRRHRVEVRVPQERRHVLDRRARRADDRRVVRRALPVLGGAGHHGEPAGDLPVDVGPRAPRHCADLVSEPVTGAAPARVRDVWQAHLRLRVRPVPGRGGVAAGGDPAAPPGAGSAARHGAAARGGRRRAAGGGVVVAQRGGGHGGRGPVGRRVAGPAPARAHRRRGRRPRCWRSTPRGAASRSSTTATCCSTAAGARPRRCGGRNAWLLRLDRVVLCPSAPSIYGRLRREPRKSFVSTLEAAADVLVAAGEPEELRTTLHRAMRTLVQRARASEAAP